MNAFQKLTLSLLVCMGIAQAGVPKSLPWPAVPTESWFLHQNRPALGNHGLILLEGQVPIGCEASVPHWYRFRVLNEAGRQEVSKLRFPSSAKAIEGRVLHPDGRIVDFKPEIDSKQIMLKSHKAEVRIGTVSLPPGLSANCMIEYRWFQEPTRPNLSAASGRGLMLLSIGLPYLETRRLSENFPVLGMTLVLWMPDLSTPLRYPVILGPQVPAPTAANLGQNLLGMTFSDIPAMEPIPFCPPSQEGGTYLRPYLIPSVLTPYQAETPEVFWRKAAIEYWRLTSIPPSPIAGNGWIWELPEVMVLGPPRSDPRGLRGSFDQFSKELREGLPPEAQAAARKLWMKLQTRIRNLSFATLDEQTSDQELIKGLSILHACSPDRMVRESASNTHGIRQLFLKLLADAGISTRVLMVTDADRGFFDPRLRNVHQFHGVLIGVPEQGKETLWFDPSLRNSNPGAVRDQFLETLGLVIDSKDGSASAFEFRPTANMETNRIHLEAKGTLAADQWQTQFDMTCSGPTATLLRNELLGMPDASRNLALETQVLEATEWPTEQFEFQFNPQPEAPLALKFRSRGELSGGARIGIPPFPGLRFPLQIPSFWPDHRSAPIRLPKRFHLVAVYTTTLPRSVAALPQSPINLISPFGLVSWTQSVAGQHLTVRFEASVHTMGASAQEYVHLKGFLATLREAFDRQVQLQESQANR